MLMLFSGFIYRTLFGNEFEISARTYLNDHKAERDVNYWIFGAADQTEIKQVSDEPLKE